MLAKRIATALVLVPAVILGVLFFEPVMVLLNHGTDGLCCLVGVL